MSNRLATIVIPCYNRLSLLKKSLSSLIQKTETRDGLSYEIIVVNDGSTEEGMREWIDQQVEEGLIRLAIHHHKNQGVAASVNDGWARAQGQYLLKYDSDMEVVDGTWLQRLAEAADAFPEVGVIGVSVEPVVEPGQYVNRNGVLLRIVRYNINGACLIVTRETFQKLGYFYQFSKAYAHEDAEYSIRSQVAGMPVAYLPGKKGFFLKNLQPSFEGDYRLWKNACSEENRPELMARIEAMRADQNLVYHPHELALDSDIVRLEEEV